MLAPGQVIGGRYRLVRLLGEGGMGAVWAATGALGREVAVKIMLREASAADPTAIDRFFAEARICGAIRHPGIVDVLDAGRDEGGVPYIVMELLDGDSLDRVLDRAGTLRPLDVLPIVRDAARTLALAHDKGVVHRDIKPGNLYLHREKGGPVIVKVLDFGISKMAVETDGPAIKTRTGTVVGSPAYMSPEQAGGRVELDARSDVYGLGVILYEALGGRLPFTEQNYNALIIDIAVHDPPPLASIAPGLPKPVIELVKAAMKRDRDQRVPTAAALADRIEHTLAALGASPAHPLPDPASVVGSGVTGPRAGPLAQTASALATSARLRARKATPWVGLAAGVVVTGGVIAAIKLIPATRSAVPATASAPSASVAPPPPLASAAQEPAPTASASASAAGDAPPLPASSASSAPASRPAVPASRSPGVKRPLPTKKKGAGVWGYE
jgi:serine/threonine-protein kinase